MDRYRERTSGPCRVKMGVELTNQGYASAGRICTATRCHLISRMAFFRSVPELHTSLWLTESPNRGAILILGVAPFAFIWTIFHACRIGICRQQITEKCRTDRFCVPPGGIHERGPLKVRNTREICVLKIDTQEHSA